jgi:hypothetical protein
MASQIGPNLNINYSWSFGENNWNIGMDENLIKLDTLTQISVISKELSSPPTDPISGDRYIVGSSPLNSWENYENYIALFINTIWLFYQPKNGFITYVEDLNKIFIYYNNIWNELITSNITSSENIDFTPTISILSTNVQDAIEEVNNKILSSQVIYPVWKINEDETIEILERQEYGINSGVLYLQGILILNNDSILVINN